MKARTLGNVVTKISPVGATWMLSIGRGTWARSQQGGEGDGGATNDDLVEEDEGVVSLCFPYANVAAESASGVDRVAGSLRARGQAILKEWKAGLTLAIPGLGKERQRE